MKVTVSVLVIVIAGAVIVTVSGPARDEETAEARRGTLMEQPVEDPGPPDGKMPAGIEDVVKFAPAVWLNEAPPETPETAEGVNLWCLMHVDFEYGPRTVVGRLAPEITVPEATI